MKVVAPKQMADIEMQSFREGASELDFMEEAGSGVALVVQDYFEQNESFNRQIILLCGKGNNAGDAYIAGVHLLHLEYEVIAYQLFPIDECSQLCKQSHFQFINDGGYVHDVIDPSQIEFPESGLIIDGIFGTGFKGKVTEPLSTIIKKANQSKLPIVAVDIPSGLNGETGKIEGMAIKATITAFLGLPKMGFFLQEGWNQVGKLSYIDFGLPKKYIDEISTSMVMLFPDMIKNLLPEMKRNRHKYEAGHVIGIAGSSEMPGAAILSCFACLYGGAGIVRLLHPEGMEIALSSGPYELIKVPYSKKNSIEVIEQTLVRANATFIGPGLTTSSDVRKILKHIIPNLTIPAVLDADALNVIAEEEIALPDNCILTPHLGEFKRLLKVKTAELNLKFLQECQKFANAKNVTLILKGGPTFIFHPNSPIIVNPRGDPGMATAGSGDVLTGLITALVAQGLTPHHAAMLGVYIHSVAGEFAALDLTSYCMTASDIISYFPDAFRPQNW